MTAAILAGFLLAFLGSVAPTGPLAVLVLERSVRRDYRAAIAVALGGAIAEAGYAALAVYGVAALLARHPGVETVARVCGLGLIVALGLRFARYRHDASPPSGAGTRGGATRHAILLGLGVSAGNPVLLLTWSTTAAMLVSLAGVQFAGASGIGFSLAVGAGVVAALSSIVALVRRHDARFTTGVATLTIRGAGVLMLALGLVSAAVAVARAAP